MRDALQKCRVTGVGPSGPLAPSGLAPTRSLSAAAMIRLAGLFSGIGVVVCLVLIAAWKASSAAHLWTISDAVTRLMLVLWPASFGMMAINPGSTTSDVILTYSILILVNAVLYGLIGVVVAAIMNFVRKH